MQGLTRIKKQDDGDDVQNMLRYSRNGTGLYLQFYFMESRRMLYCIM